MTTNDVYEPSIKSYEHFRFIRKLPIFDGSYEWGNETIARTTIQYLKTSTNMVNGELRIFILTIIL